jgi:GT2 family glycosyltransferase
MVLSNDLPSLNFKPKYLSDVSSWHEHLHFAYDLVAKVSPKNIVELGVHYGDSYFTFCQSVKDHEIDCRCFGIDTWKGEEHAGRYGEEVWETVIEYNNANYLNFSNLIRGTFSSAVSNFKDHTIDILHIDGLHTYEAVKKDFYTWIPKVSLNGIVLIHDIEEFRDDFGVHELWQEIQKTYSCFSFNHGHGLGVVFKESKKRDIDFYFTKFSDNILDSAYYQAKGESLALEKERDSLKHKNISLIAEYEIIKKSNESLVCALEDQKLLTEDLKSEVEESETLLVDIQNNLSSTVHENLLLLDKLKRIKHSLSWKITNPLRFLRRKFIDPFQRDKSFFDARLYLELNPDLQESFGNDLEGAASHFLTIGKKEGRQFLRPQLSSRLNYKEWIHEYDKMEGSMIEKFSKEYTELKERPLLSVVVPVFNTPPKILLETIDSVKRQIYENWELIIVDDDSNRSDIIETLSELQDYDKRLKIIFRDENGHISEASNTGLENVSGEFVLFLDHDDLLREHSLLRFAQTLNENPTCKLIYSDEDKINSLGKRVDPYFKPDWNPDLLLSQNYICHLCCINVDLVREISGFRKGYEGCQDWDLFLRATELLNENEIFHIPEILYHWRKGGGSTASGAKAKEYVFENSIKTIESALDRRKIEAEVELSDESNNYIRIKYNISKIQPLVSIIIPTRDYLKYLRVCIEGILTGTSYENFEILILDNESKDKSTLDYFDQLSNDERIRIIKTPGKFNYSKINNLGVTYAKGELLLFLNNDIEPISDNWLTEMVSHGIRPEIGCVGAKLLYPNDTIQHGGVVLGLGGLAGHAFKSFPMDHSGYKNRLCLVQNYSAVTAACLLVKKKLFEQVGGFNEENLQVAFNDVDFCLKVREQGFRNLWTPFALLYHFESASRGDDLSPKKLKRFNKEAEYMKKTWKNELSFDPAYNSNLTLDREDFSLGLPRSRN